jgi:hypothetical protein
LVDVEKTKTNDKFILDSSFEVDKGQFCGLFDDGQTINEVSKSVSLSCDRHTTFQQTGAYNNFSMVCYKNGNSIMLAGQ